VCSSDLASHSAGSNSLALPMGARLRLKAGFDISGFPPEVQKIFRAMKKYGLIVADNGSDMYVSGTYDTRWNNDIINPAFRAVSASDFEVIRLGYQPPQITYFPHLAVGGGYTTVFSLVNTGAVSASGNLFLLDSSGSPLDVASRNSHTEVGSRHSGAISAAASPLSISLPAGATTMLTINPADPSLPMSGWARLESFGGAVTGVATFQRVDGGFLSTIAGVFAAAPVQTAYIPVDNDGGEERFTGFAIANPNEEQVSIRLTTLKEDGTPADEFQPPALNPLAAHAQVAAYLHQFLDSALKFRGLLKLAADGGQRFVVVALQQSHGLFTAIPVITGK
jgi:hypothetical protein